MFTIPFREFTSLFKSIRSIIIIAVLFGVTIGAAKIISNFQTQLQELGIGDDAYAGALMALLLFAAPLFVTSLAHSVVNKEMASRTVRFLATKTSRANIILGKFLGNLFFWAICLFLALLLIIPFSNTFHIVEWFQMVVFVSYFIGLAVFLSTIFRSPSLTMFLGITISIALQVLGLWSLATENVFVKMIGYITPYFYYSQDQTYMSYIVVLFTLIFVILSLLIFRKRDL
ncbi:ABC transporter permease [Thalassobacillus devorans]|uniref:ABC transporter permease n=1 Tax=Thalassobacillus devorans TaxID=279813 RepID=UPI000A1CF1A0|nr:ABC transporter permease subunit [Thalassobacillus devorans]